MNNLYLNCPDGKSHYFFVGFADGNVESVQVGEGEGPKAEFVISGEYEVFAKISRAELGAQKALMGGLLKLKGNMVKALKLASLSRPAQQDHRHHRDGILRGTAPCLTNRALIISTSPAASRRSRAEMAKEKIDLYLGSRLRTMSWTTDAFFPWRSFIVIPADGLPTAFTFVIDAARAADDSWLDEDHVTGFCADGRAGSDHADFGLLSRKTCSHARSAKSASRPA